MLIFGIALIILGCLALFIIASEEAYATTVSFIATCVFACGVFVLVDSSSPKEPTALDVYRGNTTLEITYRDSIPVDTVVVFRD